MPIGKFESEVLRLLAANRNPESFVAGATVLNQAPDSERTSQDIDLFHDTEESLRLAFEIDTAKLREAGLVVERTGPVHPTFFRTIVKRGTCVTKIEWAYDSAFRFFPVEKDPELGWRLNFWDAATNKVLALVGRQTLRDYLDTLFLHRRYLPFGALAWAAAGKDPGLTPELIVDWAARANHFRPEDLAEAHLERPVDLQESKREWLVAIAEARRLIEKLPPAELGCFYLNQQLEPVPPNPQSEEFPKLIRHFGSVRGAWPKIIE